MFDYQIRSMRATIDKLLKNEPPPEKVGIKRDHAEYLKVDFSTAAPINEVSAAGIRPGVLYGSIVMVGLHPLYIALKDAVGVDNERSNQTSNTGAGKTQAPNADNDQEPQAVEGNDGS